MTTPLIPMTLPEVSMDLCSKYNEAAGLGMSGLGMRMEKDPEILVLLQTLTLALERNQALEQRVQALEDAASA